MYSRFGKYTGGQKYALVDPNLPGLTSESGINYYKYEYTNFFNFEYTNLKGMWDLSTTNMFPKPESKIVTSGLTEPLFVKGSNWITPDEQSYIQYTLDISRYRNKSARVVFRLDNNTFTTADYQVDLVNISGTSYSFENTGHNWQTSTNNAIRYDLATWATLAVGTTNGRWNVDTGGTPTVGAANTAAAGGTYYVYAETTNTSTVTSYFMWLRSPVIALGATPTLSFYLCRFANGPYFTVHLDVQA
jgi:hypothetical protein